MDWALLIASIALVGVTCVYVVFTARMAEEMQRSRLLSAPRRKFGLIGGRSSGVRGESGWAMARGEGYAIVLAEEERSELEHRAACYTLPHKRVQRAKLVLYAAGGATNAEIGRRLEMNADVVGRWRKRFHEERLEGLEDRARAGRPRRFPPGRSRPGQGSRVRAAQPAGRAAVALLAR